MKLLRAPFPYQGGKGKDDVVQLAWAGMGCDVKARACDTKERLLAAIYTARLTETPSPAIADVCKVAGCSAYHMQQLFAQHPEMVVLVGAARVRLSGKGKSFILEAAGRSSG